MPWQLSDIRRKVRQVSGRISSNSLSTNQLDEYINNYYQFTFPAEVKLERQHTYYEFLTTPNVQNYTFPNDTYTNVEPPLYLNQRPLLYYQDPNVFKNENPLNVQQQTPWNGDGSTVTFNTTVQFPYIVAGSTMVTDNVEVFVDDGNGVLTGDMGGTGTVGYTTGQISVSFNTAPVDGQNIYVTFTQYQPGMPSAVLLYNNFTPSFALSAATAVPSILPTFAIC